MSEIINNYLNGIGRGFCDYAADMFIQSSVLIILLLIIDFLLRRRVRATFRYWVWMLVFIKLILPPSLSLPTGIGYWYGDAFQVNVSESKDLPDIVQTEPAASVIQERTSSFASESEAVTQPSEILPVQPAQIRPQAVASIEQADPDLIPLTRQGVLFGLWLTGVVVITILLLQRIMFVRGLVSQSEPADDNLIEMLNQCRKKIGIERAIELRLLNNIQSPAVCGLFRPVILIPKALLEKLSHEKLRTVLIHELAHLKRGDLWINCAQTLLQIVYFYNPLIWLVNVIVRRVREQAVDEMVLVTLGPQAKTYSNTLIDIAEMAFFKTSLSLRLIGVVESKKALQGRIKHMLARPVPKNAKLGLFGFFTIIIVAAILLPMAQAQRKNSGAPVPKLSDLDQGQIKGKKQLGFNAMHPQTLWQIIPSDRQHNPKWYFRVNGKDYPLGITGQFPTSRYELVEGYCFPYNLDDKDKQWPDGDYKLSVVIKNTVWLDPEGKRHYYKELATDPIDFKIKEGNFLSKTGLQLPYDKAKEKIELNIEKYSTTLPNGVTVELVGLCGESVDNAVWWRMDGSEMPEPSFEAGRRPPPMQAVPVRYTFLARAQGRENISMRMKIYEGSGWSTRVAPDGTALCYVKHPDDSQTHHEDAFEKGPIEIGVAQGQWIKGRGPSSSNIQIHKSYLVGNDDQIVIQPPQAEKSSPEMATIFWATASSTDYEYRLVCTLKDASTKECMMPFFQSANVIETGGLSSGKLQTLSFNIDVPIDQIVNYELFYRKFNYVRFNNVAFRPGVKTDVQIEAADYNESSLFQSGRSEQVVGIIQEDNGNIGQITAEHGDAVYGNNIKYTPGLYLGRVRKGDEVQLLHSNVIQNEYGIPIIKIKTISSSPGLPTGTIGWIQLKDTSFKDQFVASENISLQPGVKTDVQVEVSKAQAEQDSVISTVSRERYFVMLVVGREKMTFEGNDVTWEQLPQMLEKVQNRPQTVLCMAIDSEEMTISQLNQIQAKTGNLSRQFSFEYFSYIGVHPLGSKGDRVSIEHIIQTELPDSVMNCKHAAKGQMGWCVSWAYFEIPNKDLALLLDECDFLPDMSELGQEAGPKWNIEHPGEDLDWWKPAELKNRKYAWKEEGVLQPYSGRQISICVGEIKGDLMGVYLVYHKD